MDCKFSFIRRLAISNESFLRAWYNASRKEQHLDQTNKNRSEKLGHDAGPKWETERIVVDVARTAIRVTFNCCDGKRTPEVERAAREWSENEHKYAVQDRLCKSAPHTEVLCAEDVCRDQETFAEQLVAVDVAIR